VPVCPKCHEFITEQHWERYLGRCGTRRKRETAPLVVNSGGVVGATPYAPYITPPTGYAWWEFGPLVRPPRKMAQKQKRLLVLYGLLSFGAVLLG
jgi:hypothetical protein